MLLDFLAQHLMLTTEYITTVANTASKRYKEFEIDKRDGSKRLIHHPSKELKCIQRCLHDEILSKLPIHNSASAYKTGSNLVSHLSRHKESNYLLRLDFKDFFHRLTDKDIKLCIAENKPHLPDGWSDDDTTLLIKLTCRYHQLTVGAVTSPSLSNILCFSLDAEIKAICDHLEVNYSRYADDLYFSTYKCNVLFMMVNSINSILSKLKYPSNLLINNNKTIHSSKKHKRRITGLILTPQGTISVGRDKKRIIRSQIFNWHKLTDKERLSLKGLLSYCNSVEPTFINSLCEKYSSGVINGILKYQISTTLSTEDLPLPTHENLPDYAYAAL